MEFIGQVKEIGQKQTLNNGTEMREIVFEQINYGSGFATDIVFAIFNEKINFNGTKDFSLKELYDKQVLSNGNVLKVLFNISARKTDNGRWFNSVTAWAINTLDYGKKPQQQQQQPQPEVKPQPQPEVKTQSYNEEPPF